MIKLPIHEQEDGWCGPASMQMVLAYYGLKKPQAELAELMRATSDDGCDPPDFVRTAEQLGFAAEFKTGYTLQGLEELVKENVPPIVGWHSPTGGDHYSVVTAFEGDLMFYADPQFGATRAISKYFFEKVWIGCYDLEPKSEKDYFEKGVIIIRKR